MLSHREHTMQLGSAAAETDTLSEVAPSVELPASADVQAESLMLNLEASLRVHGRAHFFSWTQGLLQGLIRHDVLVCALRDGNPLAFRVDSFSTSVPDPAVFGEMLLADASAVPNLIKAWKARRFRPVICEVGAAGPLGGGSFAQELERAGAPQLLVHGTHDADGQVSSLFLFACGPGCFGSDQGNLAQLVVPFLHSAWVRAQLGAVATGDEDLKPAALATRITSRELEILRWMYLGKSNFEIGAILDISGFTAKNHVQKILRKLNVVNRAQAVGKALELRILTP
jgi:transcriptional regulator EpsA